MISQKQIDIIIEVMKPYNPKKIGIFGSFARGENTEKSDLDILCEFDFKTKFTYFDRFDLIENLEKALNMKVDLISENGIHHLMRDSVMNDLVIIFKNGKKYSSDKAYS